MKIQANKKDCDKYEFTNSLISFTNLIIKKNSSILNDLYLGKSVALVSDAGMPSICDPGEELIKARINGIKIICIPGACAAVTALVKSGYPSSKFIFEGFL